jgi:hypothetical protein
MLRRLLAISLLVVAAVGCGGRKTETQTTTTVVTPGAMSVQTGAPTDGTGTPPGYGSETAAHTHCPSDTVVWLNTKTKVYHEKGMLYYGHTKQGAYVCKKEADAAGDRETKNAK